MPKLDWSEVRSEVRRREVLKRLREEMERAVSIVADDGLLGVPDWAVAAQAFLFKYGA